MIENIYKALVIIGLGIIVFLLRPTFDSSLGNIADGQAYNSTTTVAGVWSTPQILKSGSGTLGSVTITGVGAGTIGIYDATTTSILLRASNLSTSTITKAFFGASTAAGTYTFDSTFNTALLVDIVGTVPSSTVSWR